MLQNRKTFTKRYNRFSNPHNMEISYSCLQMKKNLKSIKSEEYSFTNFCSSMGCKKYKIIKKLYLENKENINILDKYFQSDELLSNNKKIERLRNLFNIIGENISKNEIIYNVSKFKNNEDNEIQLYVYRKGKVQNLLLIDLYHLGIFAKKNNKYIWQQKYDKHKNDKCDLFNITK